MNQDLSKIRQTILHDAATGLTTVKLVVPTCMLVAPCSMYGEAISGYGLIVALAAKSQHKLLVPVVTEQDERHQRVRKIQFSKAAQLLILE